MSKQYRPSETNRQRFDGPAMITYSVAGCVFLYVAGESLKKPRFLVEFDKRATGKKKTKSERNENQK
jgi:hypothetical protein